MLRSLEYLFDVVYMIFEKFFQVKVKLLWIRMWLCSAQFVDVSKPFNSLEIIEKSSVHFQRNIFVNKNLIEKIK